VLLFGRYIAPFISFSEDAGSPIKELEDDCGGGDD